MTSILMIYWMLRAENLWSVYERKGRKTILTVEVVLLYLPWQRSVFKWTNVDSDIYRRITWFTVNIYIPKLKGFFAFICNIAENIFGRPNWLIYFQQLINVYYIIWSRVHHFIVGIIIFYDLSFAYWNSKYIRDNANYGLSNISSLVESLTYLSTMITLFKA